MMVKSIPRWQGESRADFVLISHAARNRYDFRDGTGWFLRNEEKFTLRCVSPLTRAEGLAETKRRHLARVTAEREALRAAPPRGQGRTEAQQGASAAGGAAAHRQPAHQHRLLTAVGLHCQPTTELTEQRRQPA